MTFKLSFYIKAALFPVFLCIHLTTVGQSPEQKFADSLTADIRSRFPENEPEAGYEYFSQLIVYQSQFNQLIKNKFPEKKKAVNCIYFLKKNFKDTPLWLSSVYASEGIIFEKDSAVSRKIYRQAAEISLRDPSCNRKYMLLWTYINLAFNHDPKAGFRFIAEAEKRKDDCKYKKVGILKAKLSLAHFDKFSAKNGEDFMEIQQEAEKIADKALLQNILSELANFYYRIQSYDKAVYHWKKALSVCEPGEIGFTQYHNNIGAVYKNTEKYDLALLHFDSCIYFAENFSNKIWSEVWQGIALENKGQIFIVQKKYEQAIEDLKKAVFLSEKNANYGTHITALLYLAKSLSENPKSLPEAKIYLDSAARSYASVSLISAPQILTFQLLQQEFADYYAKTGDYQKAFQYHVSFKQIQDSLQRNTIRKESEELQIRYETEKKDREIEHQKQTIDFQERQNWFVLAGTIAAVLFALYLFYLNRQKQKINQLLENKNREIETQKAEVEILNQTKDQLFAIISHDLRSPINSLKNFMEILEMDIPKEERLLLQQDVFRLLDNSFQTLDNLLNWADAQMSGIRERPQTIDIQNLSRQVVMFLQTTADSKNIRIENSIEEEHKIWADPDHLQLILRNVLSNAVKFTPQNGKITLESQDTGREIRLTVRDTGRGISAENLEKILGKNHFSTKGTAGEKGTGLGLVLCREFAEKNNGRLEIESPAEGGTAVSMIFPKTEKPAN